MPIMTEGADEAEAVAEEIKANRPRRFRIRQFGIKAGEEALVRFVSDYVSRPLASGGGATLAGWISVDVHGFIPTKPKPDEYTGQNWPEKMWAICMRDRMFRLRDPQDPRKLLDEFEEGYGQCYIHDTYAGVIEGPFKKDRGLPDAQVMALAVLREPVIENGAAIGIKDKTAEWTDEKGNVFTVPHFVIISQKYENFFAQVKAACYVEPATATNKDFLVKRVENKYFINMVNQTPAFMTGTQDWAKQYEAVLAMMGFDLREHVLSHATQDHYDRWFIPGAMPKDGYARKDAAVDEDTAAPRNDAAPAAPQLDLAAMQSFRDSLQTRGSAAAAPAAAGS
jgi:hypothetical protein